MRVIITGGRTPFAFHLTRVFGAAGHQVLVTDSQRYALASYSKLKKDYRRTPPARFDYPGFSRAILEIVADFRPDLVVPSCEEVFYLSHLFAERGISDLLFAPPFEQLARAHDKAQFAVLADELGFGAEQNHVLRSDADVANFPGDPSGYVFKPVWSRFASNVLIGPSPSALAAADIHPTAENPWLAQRKIVGPEISVYAVIHRGRLVAMSPYRSFARAGKGTGISFAPVDAPDVRAFLERFGAATGWHGQVSFDFIRETDTGKLVAIEANPRATSGVFFFTRDSNLPAAIIDGVPPRTQQTRHIAIKGLLYWYGLASLIGRVPRQPWIKDMIFAQDAFRFPGDGWRLMGQGISMMEVMQQARAWKITPQEASLYDLEWNGGPIG